MSEISLLKVLRDGELSVVIEIFMTLLLEVGDVYTVAELVSLFGELFCYFYYQTQI